MNVVCLESFNDFFVSFIVMDQHNSRCKVINLLTSSSKMNIDHDLVVHNIGVAICNEKEGKNIDKDFFKLIF